MVFLTQGGRLPCGALAWLQLRCMPRQTPVGLGAGVHGAERSSLPSAAFCRASPGGCCTNGAVFPARLARSMPTAPLKRDGTYPARPGTEFKKKKTQTTSSVSPINSGAGRQPKPTPRTLQKLRDMPPTCSLQSGHKAKCCNGSVDLNSQPVKDAAGLFSNKQSCSLSGFPLPGSQ